MKKTLLITINIIALLLSLIWLATSKSLESLITCLVLLASIITLIFSKNNTNRTIMNQRGGDHSTNYQAGNDLHITTRNAKK